MREVIVEIVKSRSKLNICRFANISNRHLIFLVICSNSYQSRISVGCKASMHGENMVVEVDNLFEVNSSYTTIISDHVIFIDDDFQFFVMEGSLF